MSKMLLRNPIARPSPATISGVAYWTVSEIGPRAVARLVLSGWSIRTRIAWKLNSDPWKICSYANHTVLKFCAIVAPGWEKNVAQEGTSAGVVTMIMNAP